MTGSRPGGGVENAATDPLQARVVHLNDCASTAAQLIAEAARRGAHWDFQPLGSVPVSRSGVARTAQRAVAGAAWIAHVTASARRHDLVHVHSAGVLKHARWATHRYLLHCHGTDVRTQQYDSRWRRAVVTGLVEAEAVFYSTPDLAEHVLPHRANATYLPVPIDSSLLPTWAPDHERPLVLFASRWGQDKGGDAQLDVAEALVRVVGPLADVAGLDWGPSAPEAARRGVRLLPIRPRPEFLSLLSTANVVVGQSAGILAASELEALGIGAPLVMPAALPLYADQGLPVLGGSPGAATEVVRGLLEGGVPHDAAVGRDYVARVHGVAGALDVVLSTYAAVLAHRAS